MADLDTHDADAPMFAPDAFRLGDAAAGLIGKARRFGRAVLAPRAAQHDRDATFPIENFRDMHGEGLLRICVPKEHGGLGASFRTYCLAAAELGRYCGATALSWNMHVCSTLWSGALADDLPMSLADRDAHNARRRAHYKRIIEQGAATAILYVSDFDFKGRQMPVSFARKVQRFLRDAHAEGRDVPEVVLLPDRKSVV